MNQSGILQNVVVGGGPLREHGLLCGILRYMNVYFNLLKKTCTMINATPLESPGAFKLRHISFGLT